MDFYLVSDQIINQISNWELIFGGQSIPNITIRLIINRGGEQGAQHSQALHSILAHFPKIKSCYAIFIRRRRVTVGIINKLQRPCHLH